MLLHWPASRIAGLLQRIVLKARQTVLGKNEAVTEYKARPSVERVMAGAIALERCPPTLSRCGDLPFGLWRAVAIQNHCPGVKFVTNVSRPQTDMT